MRPNRSMPSSEVIPTLAYPDVLAAADWLCTAFGFRPRLRIASHRIQLSIGDTGSVVLTQGALPMGALESHSLMVRVADVHAHHAQASAAGVQILAAPQNFPYGECQYRVADLAGHVWTLSETRRDSDPAEWGGILAAS